VAVRAADASIPREQPFTFANREVVDAGVAGEHQPGVIEFPVVVSIRPEPVAFGVMPFIGKTNRDACARERPEFLDQAVLRFVLPLACQKVDDLGPAVDELVPLRHRLSIV
jgi:hypothetical protein